MARADVISFSSHESLYTQDSTGRYAVELGYRTIMLTDATAAFSREGMKAAADVSYPAFAHLVTTTEEIIKKLRAHYPHL
jgi:nicotinamidase-related amidase